MKLDVLMIDSYLGLGDKQKIDYLNKNKSQVPVFQTGDDLIKYLRHEKNDDLIIGYATYLGDDYTQFDVIFKKDIDLRDKILAFGWITTQHGNISLIESLFGLYLTDKSINVFYRDNIKDIVGSRVKTGKVETICSIDKYHEIINSLPYNDSDIKIYALDKNRFFYTSSGESYNIKLTDNGIEKISDLNE